MPVKGGHCYVFPPPPPPHFPEPLALLFIFCVLGVLYVRGLLVKHSVISHAGWGVFPLVPPASMCLLLPPRTGCLVSTSFIRWEWQEVREAGRRPGWSRDSRWKPTLVIKWEMTRAAWGESASRWILCIIEGEAKNIRQKIGCKCERKRSQEWL